MPNTNKLMLDILINLFLSNLIENTTCASDGMIIKPMIKAEIIANVFVNARGLKSFPSAACMKKTGKKLTTVVVKAVITADATSTVAS